MTRRIFRTLAGLVIAMMLLSSSTALPTGWSFVNPMDSPEHGVKVHPTGLVRVTLEYAKAPDCEAFAGKSKTVIEEWYPKINDILFGPDHLLPGDSVTLVCEPMKSIAYSDIRKNRIHVSAEYIKAHPEDYGMVVHELTHIVQHYVKLKREDVWLQEGIADFDNLAAAVDPTRDSYRAGYRVTAAFLFWLDARRHRLFAAKVSIVQRRIADSMREPPRQSASFRWLRFRTLSSCGFTISLHIREGVAEP